MKILLVQLASMGDCLFVTSIAKKIKEIDYPNCHLTWLIGEKYKSLLDNNPYIDEIITAEINTQVDRFKMDSFIEPIKSNFDKIIITDFCKKNYSNFYGTTRSAFHRAYGTTTSSEIEPQIFLSDSEVENVNKFAQKHKLNDGFPILLECGPESGQSPLTFEVAQELAKKITTKNNNIKFIFSSKSKLETSNKNFIDANSLTYRENAELTKYCKLLLGASSGITWLNTSNWSAKIPMVIVVNKDEKYFNGILSASVEEDFNYWGLSINKLIEFSTLDENKIVDCILTIADKSFDAAKEKYPSIEIKTKEQIETKCLKYALSGYLNEMFKYYTDAPAEAFNCQEKKKFNKFKYYRYKILSKMTVGKTKKRYKQKYNEYKALIAS